MNDMLMKDLNHYQGREYPKDTPEEKAARLAGFEGGRQYEAALRDAKHFVDAAPLVERLKKIQATGALVGAAYVDLHAIIEELS